MKAFLNRLKSRAARAIALLLVVLWPATAAAYRPFDSTDAAVAKRGEAEVELGPGYQSEAGARAIVAPRTVLNLGVLPRLELVLEGIGLFPLGSDPAPPRFRLEDTGLFLKGVLRKGCLQEASGPSVATEVGALLPTLNAESGVGASLAMIASQQWDALTAHLNGQVLHTRAKNLGLFGGLIVEGPDRWAVRPVGEVLVASESGRPRIVSGLFGAIWRVADRLALDAGFRTARRGDLAEYEVRVGFTWDTRLWGQQ